MSLNSYQLSGLVVLLSLLFACENDSPPAQTTDGYSGSFSVRYLADGQQLRGQAILYNPDSTSLQLPQGVAFMSSGSQLKQLPNQFNRYDAQLRLPYTSPLRFSFTLPNQSQQTEISVPMDGIDDFEILSASKTEGIRLRIKGSVATEETLRLMLTTSEQELRTIVRPGPVSGNELLIPADALALYEPGEYRLYLLKNKQVEGAPNNTFTYNFDIEYYTPEKTLTLAE